MRPKDLEQAYKRALRRERTAWQAYEQHLDGPENTVRQHLDIWRNSVRQVDVARDVYLSSQLAPVGEAEDDAPAPPPESLRDLQADLQRAVQEQKSAFAEFERCGRKRGTPDRDAYATWLDALRATNSVRGHLESERERLAGQAGAPAVAHRPRTELVGDAKPPEDDGQILRALAVTASHANAGATQFRVGLRNGAGVVYRTATLFGVAEKVNFARQLEALGYEDERFVGRKPPAGYDLMYSKPP
ncbi:MAG: hypothetical protein JWQ76_4735 [Ramlibacter sp.]|nr:hypothetical protein [Ramlibacter sp.]